MSKETAETLVASAASNLEQQVVPEELRTQIVRQNKHLIELAGNLLASGMDEDSIKSVVRDAMDSYEQELVQTILTLKAESDDDGS